MILLLAVLRFALVVSSAIAMSFSSDMGGAECNMPCKGRSVPTWSALENYSPVGSRPLFTANGCGTDSIRIDAPDALVPCCVVHDACYSVCGIKRKFCDDEFAKCLTEQCRSATSPQLKQECDGSASTMSSGVAMFGCSAFLDAQKERCECADFGTHEKRVDTLIREHLYPLASAAKSNKEISDIVRRAVQSNAGVIVYHILQKYNKTLIQYKAPASSGRYGDL